MTPTDGLEADSVKAGGMPLKFKMIRESQSGQLSSAESFWEGYVRVRASHPAIGMGLLLLWFSGHHLTPGKH